MFASSADPIDRIMGVIGEFVVVLSDSVADLYGYRGKCIRCYKNYRESNNGGSFWSSPMPDLRITVDVHPTTSEIVLNMVSTTYPVRIYTHVFYWEGVPPPLYVSVPKIYKTRFLVGIPKTVYELRKIPGTSVWFNRAKVCAMCVERWANIDIARVVYELMFELWMVNIEPNIICNKWA